MFIYIESLLCLTSSLCNSIYTHSFSTVCLFIVHSSFLVCSFHSIFRIVLTYPCNFYSLINYVILSYSAYFFTYVYISAVGIRHADHVAYSIHKKLALTSLTSGSRSVGTVRLRTEATEFFYVYIYLFICVFIVRLIICPYSC
jgi:hypothetical protein